MKTSNFKSYYHLLPSQNIRGRNYTKKSTASSNDWLKRQRDDMYVKQAHKDGFYSRAAYKLLQMLTEGNYLSYIKKKRKEENIRVVDLGSAPGSWSQVMALLLSEPPEGNGLFPSAFKSLNHEKQKTTLEYISINNNPGHHIHTTANTLIQQNLRNQPPRFSIISIDRLEMEKVNGVEFIQGDFTDDSIKAKLKEKLPNGQADIVLSDMAPSATGDNALDHDQLIDLAEQALFFALSVLPLNSGVFIAKISRGSAEIGFKKEVSKYFENVKMEKPGASRSDSREIYVAAWKLKTNKIDESFDPFARY